MNTEINFEILTGLLEKRQMKELHRLLSQMNEIDVALFICELEPEDARLVFRMAPKDVAAEVFANLDPETQQILLEGASDDQLKQIIEDLYVDDAVDMLEELPANVVKRILKQATRETRDIINQYLQYPENSAGSIMTAEFVDLKGTMTVPDAIAHIRKTGEDSESIYTCYVIDAMRVLQGVITVKDLLLAKDDVTIADIMETEVISCNTMTDREDAAHMMSHYDLLSLPVVDNEKRLVGMITIDDAVDVMEKEANEDFEAMSGIVPTEKAYLKSGVTEMARHRIPWLMILMFSGMITGGILSSFESAISALPLLVSFVPMLTDTGGNSGSQASTMIIRGIATGDISIRNLPTVLWKECRVGMLVGSGLACANFLRIGLQYHDWMIACAVSVTMFFTVIIAKLIGGLLPLLADALHLDPAIIAAPMITTVVDACSLLVFFAISTAMLPI